MFKFFISNMLISSTLFFGLATISHAEDITGAAVCENSTEVSANPNPPTYDVPTGQLDIPLLFVPNSEFGWYRATLGRMANESGKLQFQVTTLEPTCEKNNYPAGFVLSTLQLHLKPVVVDFGNGTTTQYEASLQLSGNNVLTLIGGMPLSN